MLSQKLNSKIVAFIFILVSFSGNISPAYANSVQPPVYNIYIHNNIKYNNIKLNNILYIDINNNKRKTAEKTKLLHSLAKAKKVAFNKKVNKVMFAIAWHESRRNYKAHSRYSSACGAYQFVKSTWNNYMGYKTACVAPRWVQDKRMRNSIIVRYNKYHDWQKVIAAHYVPAWADSKWKWWRTPFGGGNKSVWSYVNNVMKKAGLSGH